MVVNAPRFAPPWYFQDRSVEVGLLGDLLRKDEVRLILVAGRGGMGKTTVACRVFAGIELGHLPDGSPFRADGIVYLNAGGFRQLTLRSVLDDLSRLRPPAAIDRLAAVFTSRHASAADKMHALLAELGGMRVLVLLDGLDRLLDPRTLELRDAELQEGLEALLATPEHGVRVVVTTRTLPASLPPVGPREQETLDLHLGLESPFAESVLEQLDADGTLGLRSAPPELLSEARRRTRGYPKALEALVNVLRTDRTTTLEDLLADTATVPPDEVQQVLVGESLDRLDPPAERVVRALAVYGRPVPPAAVDYMLLPFQQGLSKPLLERLVGMHLVRVEAGRYFLEPDERSHAYERLPDGLASDRTERPPPFTKAALLFWGAEYCRHAPPTGGRPSPEDQELSLLEVDLRRRAGDYEEAARLLGRSARRYLLPQGEMALLAQEGQRLEGVLPDSALAYRTIMLLGLALRRLGDHDAAIVRFARARQLARRLGDGLAEKKALTNLATCYFELGRVTEAASWYERAIELARTLEHEDAQAEPLLNLGLCYSQAGDLARAVDHYREGLRIATDASKLGLQSQVLANLGSVQAEMGRPSEALDTLEGGLAIAMQTGEHYVIGRCHGNIAEVLVDRGELDPAADRAKLAADAGERLHRSELAGDGYATVALAHLLAGRLAEARTAVAAAGQFAKGSSRRAPAVFALSGVVALREGRTEEAYEAFHMALAGTVKLLDNGRNPLPRAFDTQGLARAGMALADDDRGENLREAVRAYEAARSLCRERGLVDRTLRLLEQLAVVDGRRQLPPVRAAAAGSDAGVHVG
jgi:tetratricopeptide (TPR) repeat protein